LVLRALEMNLKSLKDIDAYGANREDRHQADAHGVLQIMSGRRASHAIH